MTEGEACTCVMGSYHHRRFGSRESEEIAPIPCVKETPLLPVAFGFAFPRGEHEHVAGGTGTGTEEMEMGWDGAVQGWGLGQMRGDGWIMMGGWMFFAAPEDG